MRRFKLGATHSGGDPASAAPQQGPEASSAGEPSGGSGANPGPGSEQPTEQQGTPGDQPAPVQSEPSRDQPADGGGQESERDGEPSGQQPGDQGDRENDADDADRGDGRQEAETDGGGEPQGESETEEQPQSRVSVVDEQPSRPAPPEDASEEEYKWHTYKQYPSGRPDAVEFIDMYKGFGRAKILRGLNMGLREGMVSMILGPSGTGKSVCIKHMVGLLYPDVGDVLVHGESVPNLHDDDLVA